MKYKLIRSEHARSDETILEADTLDEMARLVREKSGRGDDLGVGGGMDLGLDDGDEGFL
jgi:hypothetical protein